MRVCRIFAAAALVVVTASALSAEIRSPEEYFGFPIGTDRKLADYNEIREYLSELAAESPWMNVETIGTTTLGRPFVMAVISTPENLTDLGRYTEISRRLADPRGLDEQEAEALVREGKTFVMITCNLHSTEIGSAQMSAQLAYDIVAARNDVMRAALEETVLFLIPSLNPDGLQMVVDWYEKWVGTEYEGCRMPWLYHHYAGHDNNRDWFMVNLDETRAVFDLYFESVVPHVILDMHQMWSTGARLFLPQFYPPANINVDPILYREIGFLGYIMQLECEEREYAGVISDAYFTGYWEGTSMMTPWWHNQVGLLSEAASVHVASPIYIEPGELRGGAKGLPRYEHRINFPNPWPGGWWRLSDIVDYELAIAEGLLDCCARHSERFLRNFYEMGARAVERGRTEAPYAFVIPAAQRDPGTAARMIETLMLGGIEVHRAADDFMVGKRLYPRGSHVIRLDQPYRAYAKDLLEVQEYPDIRASEKEDFVRPYDMTGWTLWMQMGVECEQICEPFEADLELIDSPPYPEPQILREWPGWWGLALDPEENGCYAAVFSLLGEGYTIHRLDDEISVAAADASATLAPGTFLVPYRKGLETLVPELAGRHHFLSTPVESEPAAGYRSLKPVKIALYKPWLASMDEGWTRLLFDTSAVPYENVANEHIKDGKIGKFDILVLPDVGKEIIKNGKYSGEYASYFRPLPPEYAGGIGDEGVEHIKDFVEGGGTLVCFGESSLFAIEALELPVTDALEKESVDDFYCPGSILEVSFKKGHPITYGMPDEGYILFSGSPAFNTTVPFGKFDRTVLASYSDKNPLASGLLIGPEKLYRRAALVEMKYDKGKVILFGFRPQHRCQTSGTYKLIFNAHLEGGKQ
jgi:hypothetical protein